MNIFMLAVLVLFVAFSTAGAQTVIDNPAKPLSPNAGRVVKLEEVMRIEDTGEDYFFKNPSVIRVSPRGDLFIQDRQEQALQFDAQGRFVRNLFKKGQGPGELTTLNDIWASQGHLFLIGSPRKILVFDHRGNLVNEISLREFGLGRFVQAETRAFLIYGGGQPDASDGGGYNDIPQNIAELGPDGAVLKTFGPFYLRGFVQSFEGGVRAWTTWNRFQAVCFDENTLVLNYTPEYLVEALDKDKEAVVRRFKRPYARVKRSGGGGISGPGGSGPPPPEFQADIFALHVVDGKIWVQTSTVVEGKGILFDVFDPDGRYIDSFFIQSNRKGQSGATINKGLTIAGGFAYFWDKTEDEFIVIKKCRLAGL